MCSGVCGWSSGYVCSAVCGWLAGYYVCSGAMAGHLAVICVVTVCVVGCVVCHLVTHV